MSFYYYIFIEIDLRYATITTNVLKLVSRGNFPSSCITIIESDYDLKYVSYVSKYCNVVQFCDKDKSDEITFQTGRSNIYAKILNFTTFLDNFLCLLLFSNYNLISKTIKDIYYSAFEL